MEKALKCLVLLLIPFLALAFGGVQEWAISTMEILLFLALFIGALLILTLHKEKLHPGSDNFILFLFLLLPPALLVFQLIPFPEKLLDLISPGLTEIADMAGIKSRTSFPSRISINSNATLNTLIESTSYIIVFIFVSLGFREKNDLKKTTYFLVFFGFAISFFGIIHKFTSNGKLYWVKELTRGGSPFGPFVNHNHFAGFIVMIIMPTLALILYATSCKRRSVNDGYELNTSILILFVSVMIAALFLTLSRGGMAGFIAGVITLFCLLIKEGEHFKRGVIAAITAVSTVGLITAIGAGTILARFSTLFGFYKESSYLYRLTGWKASFEAFKDFLLFGTGGGTFADIFTVYRPLSMRSTFIHAHNEYIQLMVESGIAGLIITLFIVVFFIKKFNPLAKRSESRGVRYLHCGFFSGLVALMVHSIVEFNFRIPSNAYLFAVLAGLCVAASPVEKEKSMSVKMIAFPCIIISLLFIYISGRNSLNTYNLEKWSGDNKTAILRRNISNCAVNHDLGLKVAEYFEEKRSYEDSKKCYSKIIESSPLKGIVWAKRSIVEELSGNIDMAERDMFAAAGIDPSNMSYRLNLGRLKFKQGKIDEGFNEITPLFSQPEWLIKAVKTALNNNIPIKRVFDIISGSHQALSSVAAYLENTGEDSYAEEAYVRSVIMDPQNSAYLDGYARFLLKKGDFDSLSGINELFVGNIPSRAFYWMSEAYHRRNLNEVSVGILSYLLELEPESIYYKELLAQRYQIIREYDRALSTALEILKQKERSYKAYLIIVSVYERKKDWLKVAKYLQGAAYLFPNNFDIRYRLAAVYKKLGMKKLALSELKSCLDIQPENIGVRLKLAEAYIEINQWEKALDEFQTVLTLDPGNRSVAAGLDRLLKGEMVK